MVLSPGINQAEFKSFWIAPEDWGTLRLTAKGIEIKAMHGTLIISEFRLLPNTVIPPSCMPHPVPRS
jgi:hypothetical protein